MSVTVWHCGQTMDCVLSSFGVSEAPQPGQGRDLPESVLLLSSRRPLRARSARRTLRPIVQTGACGWLNSRLPTSPLLLRSSTTQ